MRFVFVMDPLTAVTHDKDTTFAFIQAAQARGHASYHCLLRDLFIQDGDAWAIAHPVEILPAPPWIRLTKDGGRRAGSASPTSRPSSCARIRPSTARTSTRR